VVCSMMRRRKTSEKTTQENTCDGRPRESTTTDGFSVVLLCFSWYSCTFTGTIVLSLCTPVQNNKHRVEGRSTSVSNLKRNAHVRNSEQEFEMIDPLSPIYRLSYPDINIQVFRIECDILLRPDPYLTHVITG
jgi:hypothetical protein